MTSISQELQSSNALLSVKEMAKRLGWSEMKAGNMFRRARRNGQRRHKMEGLALTVRRSKTRLPDGSLDYVTLAEFEQFEEMIQSKQKKPGYGTLANLQKAVAAEDGATKREVGECATLWHQIKKLRGEEAIVEVPVKDKRNRSYTRTMRLMTYEIDRFKELWTKTLRDNVGATYLKELLPFGTRRPVAEADDEMKQKGLVGIRLQRAKRLAGVIARLPEGDHGGAAWLYERIDPRKKMEPIRGCRLRTVPLDEIKKMIVELFAKGALLVRTYHKALQERNLSRQVGTVRKAERELGYKTKRIGPRGTPSVCKIKGQEWPSEIEATRMVGIVGTELNGLPIHGPQSRRRFTNWETEKLCKRCYIAYRLERESRKLVMKRVDLSDESLVTTYSNRYADSFALPRIPNEAEIPLLLEKIGG